MTRRRGKVPSQRQLRVGEELRHALARILARGGVRDPALEGANITVTEVRVSPDLKSATAFVTPFAADDEDGVIAGLQRAAPFFRARLGREVKLRYTPQLRFEADTSFDEAARIEALLQKPRVRRDLEEPHAADDDEDGTEGRDNDD